MDAATKFKGDIGLRFGSSASDLLTPTLAQILGNGRITDASGIQFASGAIINDSAGNESIDPYYRIFINRDATAIMMDYSGQSANPNSSPYWFDPDNMNRFTGDGGALTNLQSSQLVGALPAIDGSALTGISGGGSTPGLAAVLAQSHDTNGSPIIFNSGDTIQNTNGYPVFDPNTGIMYTQGNSSIMDFSATAGNPNGASYWFNQYDSNRMNGLGMALPNGAALLQGSTDNGLGAAGGIALMCSVAQWLTWQAGHLANYVSGAVTDITLDSNLLFGDAQGFKDGSGYFSLYVGTRLLSDASNNPVLTWDAQQTSNVNGSLYWLDGNNGGRLTGDGSGLTGIMSESIYDPQGLGYISGISRNGGKLNMDGVGGGSGGYINTSGQNGNSGGFIDTNGTNGANGGNINTSGGSAGGGNINTSGGSAGGGSINTYNGGGSINTYTGGGSIDTTGTGNIQLGIVATRTTLTGNATTPRTIALPDNSGTLALLSDIPTQQAVNSATGTMPVADGTYIVGIGVSQNGTITTVNGVITAIQQAS